MFSSFENSVSKDIQQSLSELENGFSLQWYRRQVVACSPQILYLLMRVTRAEHRSADFYRWRPDAWTWRQVDEVVYQAGTSESLSFACDGSHLIHQVHDRFLLEYEQYEPALAADFQGGSQLVRSELLK